MQTNNIPAERAVAWFKQGWEIFSKDMKTWLFMASIMGVGAIVINLLPIIGQMIMLLLMPALIGGMLYAAKQVKEGHPIKVDYLWWLLQDAHWRMPFLLLGGLLFAAAVIVAILSAAFVGDSLLRGATLGLAGFGMGGLIFMFIVGFSSFVVFNYTPALMLFKDLSLVDALKHCVSTAITQPLPLLLLFLIYAVLSFIAALPFGLGLLVLIPVTVGAVYVSYEEIFA